jgi:hypothetical protein
MTDTTPDIYEAMAVRQLADEDALARVTRVQERADLLRETAARTAQLRSLAEEHGLPPDASPRALSDAMESRCATFWSRLAAQHGGKLTVPLRQLAGEVGLDPDHLPDPMNPYRCVFDAMRQAKHPLTTARWDEATNQFIRPAAAPAA